MLSFEEFQKNVERLKRRIANACSSCDRSPAEVKLMAVSKTQGPEAILYAERCGLPCAGENRIQEAAEKVRQIKKAIPVELIGHLQSNKAKLAVEIFDRIQSVDRSKLIKHLERHGREQGKVMPVLLQVNTGEDPRKFGVSCEEAPALLEAALEAESLKVEGLMSIAPLDNDPAVAEKAFHRLRELRDKLAVQFALALPELSMGMTSDLEAAVKAGSTCVRIGTALYGPRT